MMDVPFCAARGYSMHMIHAYDLVDSHGTNAKPRMTAFAQNLNPGQSVKRIAPTFAPCRSVAFQSNSGNLHCFGAYKSLTRCSTIPKSFSELTTLFHSPIFHPKKMQKVVFQAVPSCRWPSVTESFRQCPAESVGRHQCPTGHLAAPW